MNDNKLTVAEVAEEYNVTTMAVRYWIKNGLRTYKRRVIGKKEHIVIDPDDVIKFLNLTEGD